VSHALQDFVDDSPNGSILCLATGATYRVDARISISRRSNLTLDGRGARLHSPVARNSSFIYVNEGSGITIRNLVIEGANAAAGTSGALNKNLQHGHAFAMEAARSVVIEGTTVRRIFGDFVYVGTNSTLAWSDGVTIRNNDFALNGRMGVAVVAGRNVFIAGNSFDKVGMYTFDIEPNRYSPPTGGDNIEFSGNWVGTGSHTSLYSPLFFGSLGMGNSTNVRILNNTLAGQALRIWVDPVEGQYVRRSFTISGNVSSVRMAGPAMRFTDVAGVTVTNNRQPLSSGELVTTSGSTGVTVTGNNTAP
jgi:Right handed beta helix region